MPKEFSRNLRVADQIQRELADLILNEIKDPRLKRINITAVEVTRDYSHAKIFYTALSNQDDRQHIIDGLEHAKGFLRTSLAQKIGLRIIPQLHFTYDKSIENGLRLSKLIDEAITQDQLQSQTNQSEH